MSFFKKIAQGLKKTTDNVFNAIAKTIISSPITDELYEELFEELILADVGYETSEFLCEELKKRARSSKAKDGQEVLAILKEIITEILTAENEMDLSSSPSVILIIGVNGVGKTTSIGKLANLYKTSGKKVLLAAADTFRAAAANQLNEWANRAKVDILIKEEGRDPASVVFEAVEKAKNENYDIVICDTAGRLHNKKNLMDELAKIRRVITKADENAKVEVLLVLESITGQNAISQAKEFTGAANATGVILTKLDGTAKGGSVLSIKRSLEIPVRFVGVGEAMDDLIHFSAEDFADALVNLKETSEENQEM